MVWGGRRLERYLGRPLPGSDSIGEAWMLSAQSLHVSRVVDGPWAGQPLTDLWLRCAEELTGRPGPQLRPFPLLLKYLDCQELLSIQVHPNDQIAAELRPGEFGKTEAWIILEADPTARIYAGLARGTTREQLEQHLAAGTVAECLHRFVPRPGDCLFLPAGTVHAVGGGVLMAEVQQSSDATFRLFDWNRLGADGLPRALHTQEALRSIDWSAGPVRPSEGRPLKDLPEGVSGRRLVDCPFFAIDRFDLSAPLQLPYPKELSIWMVLEGAVRLTGPASGESRTLSRGQVVLVPATAEPLRWEPVERDAPSSLLGILPPQAT
jgi:mannose-6-phosphate isomerase